MTTLWQDSFDKPTFRQMLRGIPLKTPSSSQYQTSWREKTTNTDKNLTRRADKKSQQSPTVAKRVASSFSILLLIGIMPFLSRTCCALSHQPQPTTLSFDQFTFASNGVCTNPSTFVHSTTTRTTPEDTDSPSAHRAFTMRNVPGTGDCMFQAVILASLTSMGLGGNDVLLRAIARETRAVVAQVLQCPNGNLIIEGNRLVPARDLWMSAAKQEGLSPQEYLEKLQLEGRGGGLYGGGPELTVLSNVLRRPISVYELDPTASTSSSTEAKSSSNNSSSCPIVCKGVFGMPRFADPCASIPNSAILSGLQPGAYSWHLHVLVSDVASTGTKHACVLLPQDVGMNTSSHNTKTRQEKQ